MTIMRKLLVALAVFLVLVGGFAFWVYRGDSADLTVDAVTGTDPTLSEAKPQTFPTVRIAEPIGWKDGELPEAAEGLTVSRFAEGLEHPRVIHTLPNGDVLVTLTRAPKSGDGGGITKHTGFAGRNFEVACHRIDLQGDEVRRDGQHSHDTARILGGQRSDDTGAIDAKRGEGFQVGLNACTARAV